MTSSSFGTSWTFITVPNIQGWFIAELCAHLFVLCEESIQWNWICTHGTQIYSWLCLVAVSCVCTRSLSTIYGQYCMILETSSCHSLWHIALQWADILVVGTDILFLCAHDMAWTKTFRGLDPHIIINVNVNAILDQKLVLQMHGWISQNVANNAMPVEVLSLLGLLPIRNS